MLSAHSRLKRLSGDGHRAVPASTGLLFGANLLSLALAATMGSPARAQASPQADTTQQAPASPSQLTMTDALNTIQPLMTQVNSALSSVDARRWKAPNDVRDQTASDIQSIQRDLNGTLPGLLSTAQSNPGSIAPAFAVFRNIDALYDVLLRITETATMAGSQDSTRLEQVRSDLQSRRSQLGNAILSSATAQDASVANLQSALRAANSAANSAAAAPRKVVVNDGPDSTAKPAKKRKATATTKPQGGATTPQATTPQ